RTGDECVLDDHRQELSRRAAIEAAVRGRVLERLQHRESRYPELVDDHLEQLRPHHGDAAGGPGRTAYDPVLAAVFVLIAPREPRRRRWQAITAAALLGGYSGYYVCRSNLSLVAPKLLAEFGPAGLDKSALGIVLSAGVLAYACGKVVNGVAGDLI